MPKELTNWSSAMHHRSAEGGVRLLGLPYIDGIAVKPQAWKLLNPDRDPKDTSRQIDPFDETTNTKVASQQNSN